MEILHLLWQLMPVGLISVVLSFVFNFLTKKTRFREIPFIWRQIIIGVLFGAASCCGTEFGIVYDGYIINVRDAAPLCAGLLFGGPAGIIAGVIGGVERWFAVLWGAGAYTRLACSISTALAGFYAAYIRKAVCDDERPSWGIAFVIGAVMEVLHMTILLLTKLSDATTAFDVLKVCTFPMALANALTVLVATMAVTVFTDQFGRDKNLRKTLPHKVQKRILIVIVIAFAATTVFMYFIQTGVTEKKAENLMNITIDDVNRQVREMTDAELLDIASEIAYDIRSNEYQVDLGKYLSEYGITVISLIDENGIITDSNYPDYIGFDMNSGEQSAEFMCLTQGTVMYAQQYMKNTKDGEYMKYAGVALSEGGFVQIGMGLGPLKGTIDATLDSLCATRHIGETGFLMVCDDSGTIVGTPTDRRIYDGKKLTNVLKAESAMHEREIVKGQLEDTDIYMMQALVEGYRVYAIQYAAEVTYCRDTEFYINSFMEIIVFAVLYIQLYELIKRLVIRNMNKVNRSLEAITGGNLDEKVDVRATAEFSELSDDINETVDTMKGYIAEVAANIEKELEFAKSIQMSVLPNIFPPYPNHKGFELHARMDTAKEVGGDFYDYFWIAEDQLVILIADVSGKGVPAALFMMNAKAALKSQMETRVPVNEAMAQANDFLCQGNDAGMFVTCWMCVVNTRTGHVQYANAGHNPPIIRHGNGEFEYLKCRPGLVLAGMDGIPYRLNEFDLEPGSMLYLYTDGVTEATDAHNELYGEDRLIERANALGDRGAWEFCDLIKADVDEFVGEAPQFDDITMVCFKFIKGEEWQDNFLSSVDESANEA